MPATRLRIQGPCLLTWHGNGQVGLGSWYGSPSKANLPFDAVGTVLAISSFALNSGRAKCLKIGVSSRPSRLKQDSWRVSRGVLNCFLVVRRSASEPAAAPDAGRITVLRSIPSHQRPARVSFFVMCQMPKYADSNCVFRLLKRGLVIIEHAEPRTWHEEDLPISSIDVQQAEPNLAFLFQRNGFGLSRLIADPELGQHEPYKSSGVGKSVHFPI